MPVTATDVAEMTAGSLKKRFYAVLSYPVASEEEMMEHIGDHLEYMGRHEGKVFLSGPFIRPGQTIGEGLTILHTENEEEAAQLMNDEPLIKLGLRRFEIKLWQVQEGSLSITVSAEKSTFILT